MMKYVKLFENYFAENISESELPILEVGAMFRYERKAYTVLTVEEDGWFRAKDLNGTVKLFYLNSMLRNDPSLEFKQPTSPIEKPSPVNSSIPVKKPMTDAQYKREVKDMISGLEDSNTSVFHDQAESMYFNREVVDYVKKKHGLRTKDDIVQQIQWDLESHAI